MIEPEHLSIDLSLCAAHPSVWMRQFAVLQAARSFPPGFDTLRVLADDHDARVRRNVGEVLPLVARSNRRRAATIRKRLATDQSWAVRKAVLSAHEK